MNNHQKNIIEGFVSEGCKRLSEDVLKSDKGNVFRVTESGALEIFETVKSAKTPSGDTVKLMKDVEGLHVSYKEYLTPCDLVGGRIMLCDGMYGLSHDKVTEILDSLEG